MASPQTIPNVASAPPASHSETTVRAKVARKYTIDYAYNNNRAIPSKEEVDKHVEDEMRRSRIFGISPGFEEQIWALVYDGDGATKKSVDALCEEWKIPAASVACRNKVQVLRCPVQFRSDRN
jgi:hypothetical protein